MKCFVFFVYYIIGTAANSRKFPDNFKFGSATASYQIEGAWNVSDKSENIWDFFTHNTNLTYGGATGDVACNSYYLYKRDVEMLEELGVDFYRFSLSWSRLLPNGFANKISKDGLRYYNALIDELISKNIQPYVTIYHWDLPQNLQLLGGWANPIMAQYFADYAKVVFEAFGDRVKLWLTFNEPGGSCIEGYDLAAKAPALKQAGIGAYLCIHNILKAHAKAYHLYDQHYRSIQKGRVSMTLDTVWFEADSGSIDDVEAAERARQFQLGWLAHPIFSHDGDYPKVMKDFVAQKSEARGFPISRLPEFTQDEINYIKGTSDFFGINHYSTWMIKSSANSTNDGNFFAYQKTDWPSSASSWLKVVPWGFTKLFGWIRQEYNNPEVMVFENGFSDTDGLEDSGRIKYIDSYLNSLLDAVEQGCNISAYTAWSLMDNFEWLAGYSERFGLYHVDFEDPNRTRTPKKSAGFYSDVIKNRSINRTETKYITKVLQL